MTLFFGICVFFLSLLGTAVVQAESSEETPWYQIELIIFEYTDISNTNTETWPDDPGAPDMSGAVDLIPFDVFDDYLALQNPPTLDTELAPPSSSSREQQLAPIAPNFDALQANLPIPEAVENVDDLGDNIVPEIDSSTENNHIADEQPFVLLPADQMTLHRAADDLRRAKAYRVLHHVAWRQPVLPAGQSVAIHVHSQMDDPEYFLNQLRTKLGQEAEKAAILLDERPDGQPVVEGTFQATQTMGVDINPLTLEPIPEQMDGAIEGVAQDDRREGVDKINKTRPPLEGLVRVSLSRYLHLMVDLTYSREVRVPARPLIFETSSQENEALILVRENPPATALSDGFTGMETIRIKPFRLIESRRMRSKEVHYIDHPAFGLVALITPYERILPADETETAIEDIMIGVPSSSSQPPVR